MMQDERMQPASSVEGSVQDRDYDYDGVGNVTAINDQLAGHDAFDTIIRRDDLGPPDD
jgi:YD repeat-containing protein